MPPIRVRSSIRARINHTSESGVTSARIFWSVAWVLRRSIEDRSPAVPERLSQHKENSKVRAISREPSRTECSKIHRSSRQNRLGSPNSGSEVRKRVAGLIEHACAQVVINTDLKPPMATSN